MLDTQRARDRQRKKVRAAGFQNCPTGKSIHASTSLKCEKLVMGQDKTLSLSPRVGNDVSEGIVMLTGELGGRGRLLLLAFGRRRF